jgi:Ca2+-binding EF-hand superfamily protein
VNATIPSDMNSYFIELIAGCWNIMSSEFETALEYKQEDKAEQDEEAEEAAKIAFLEDTLSEKLRQRTKTKEDEGKAMMRAIRYVDTSNTGAINLKQFTDMLRNLGCFLLPENTKKLFRKFADESSETICAEKMANYFALKNTGENPNVVPKFKVAAEPPNQVLEKIKKTLIEKGVNGMRGMGKLLRKADKSGSKKISRHEFAWAMKENGHILYPQELERLFNYFDRNKDGVIYYNEFIRAIRGDLSERRKEAVDKTFKKLDAGSEGRIGLGQLASFYRVESHPKVH